MRGRLAIACLLISLSSATPDLAGAESEKEIALPPGETAIGAFFRDKETMVLVSSSYSGDTADLATAKTFLREYRSGILSDESELDSFAANRVIEHFEDRVMLAGAREAGFSYLLLDREADSWRTTWTSDTLGGLSPSVSEELRFSVGRELDRWIVAAPSGRSAVSVAAGSFGDGVVPTTTSFVLDEPGNSGNLEIGSLALVVDGPFTLAILEILDASGRRCHVLDLDTSRTAALPSRSEVCGRLLYHPASRLVWLLDADRWLAARPRDLLQVPFRTAPSALAAEYVLEPADTGWSVGNLVEIDRERLIAVGEGPAGVRWLCLELASDEEQVPTSSDCGLLLPPPSSPPRDGNGSTKAISDLRSGGIRVQMRTSVDHSGQDQRIEREGRGSPADAKRADLASITQLREEHGPLILSPYSRQFVQLLERTGHRTIVFGLY